MHIYVVKFSLCLLLEERGKEGFRKKRGREGDRGSLREGIDS